MAEWVCAQDPLALGTRQRLATHLLDAVGARIAGSATEEGAMVARLFSEAPLDRAALGAATIKLTEIDDIHMASCTAPGSVVVPAALAIASRMPRSEVFARALRAGYEVITRFGIAVAGPDILHRGIWPTLLAAPLGAAAVTACLLGLDASKTTNALGIALTLMSGSPGGPTGASPRWLLLGIAASEGCVAALAAAEGFDGDPTLLDTDWMVRTHGIYCETAPLVAATQEPGAIAEVSLKPCCAAKQCIAAIDAFRNLLEQGILPTTSFDCAWPFRRHMPPWLAIGTRLEAVWDALPALPIIWPSPPVNPRRWMTSRARILRATQGSLRSWNASKLSARRSGPNIIQGAGRLAWRRS
jgi:2-methylcitrate dehydratase PrpD